MKPQQICAVCHPTSHKYQEVFVIFWLKAGGVVCTVKSKHDMASWFKTKTREHVQSTDFIRTFTKNCSTLMCSRSLYIKGPSFGLIFWTASLILSHINPSVLSSYEDENSAILHLFIFVYVIKFRIVHHVTIIKPSSNLILVQSMSSLPDTDVNSATISFQIFAIFVWFWWKLLVIVHLKLPGRHYILSQTGLPFLPLYKRCL